MLTSEQRVKLYQWRAGPLFEAINKNENLFLDDKERKLGLSYPNSGEEPQKFAALQPEQQASLLKLIVDHHSDLTDLLELSERYQLSSLLENISEDQLSEFLSPPQVRAVLREKQILIDKRFQRLTIPQQNFQFPVRLLPAQIPLQKPCWLPGFGPLCLYAPSCLV